MYIADARTQELPLLGGDDSIHDWWYLLTKSDLLAHDLAIAGGVRAVSILCRVVSAGGALAFAREGVARRSDRIPPRAVNCGRVLPVPPTPSAPPARLE